MSFLRGKKDKNTDKAAASEAASAVARSQADLLSQLTSPGGVDAIFGDDPEEDNTPSVSPAPQPVYSIPVPGPPRSAVQKPSTPSVPVVPKVPTVPTPKAATEYGAPVPGPTRSVPSVSVPAVSVPAVPAVPIKVNVAIPSISVPSVAVAVPSPLSPSSSSKVAPAQDPPSRAPPGLKDSPGVALPGLSSSASQPSIPPRAKKTPQSPPSSSDLGSSNEDTRKTETSPQQGFALPGLSSSGSQPFVPPRARKSTQPLSSSSSSSSSSSDLSSSSEDSSDKTETGPKKPSPSGSPDRTSDPQKPPVAQKPRAQPPLPSSSSASSVLTSSDSSHSEEDDSSSSSSSSSSSPSVGNKSWGWTKPKERNSTTGGSRIQFNTRSSKDMQEEANEATSHLPSKQQGNGNDAETESKEGDESDVEHSKVGYCLYDYEIQNDGEIELKSGDYVIVVQEAGEWLYVRCGDSYGYVAASYVQIINEDNLSETSDAPPPTESAPLGPSNDKTQQNDTSNATQEQQDPSSSSSSSSDSSGDAQRSKASNLQIPVTMDQLRLRAMSINRPVLNSGGLTPKSPPLSSATRAPPSPVDPKKLKKATTFGSFRGLKKKKKKEPEMEFHITRVDSSAPLSASTSAIMTNSGPPSSEGLSHSASASSVLESGTSDSSSSPSSSPEHQTPMEDVDQRTKIAREILSTEEHYVNILDALLRKYRDPLKQKIGTEGFGVTDQQLKDIFSNLHLILPINQELLEELRTKVKKEWSDSQCVGDTFFRVAPFLKMYNQYGNNYNNAIQTFNRCMQKPAFVAAVEECDGTTNISTRLDGLLITPVQRLPRYLMLLSEIKRHTPEGHPDHAFLDKAIPAMQEVADHVNNFIRQSENQQKLMELSLKGAQTLLKPHRNLVTEMIISDESKKRKLHIYAFNDILVHLSEAKAKNKANLTKNENQWPWHLVWIDPDPIPGLASSSFASRKPDCFEVIGPTGSYLFKSLTQATALEDCQRWKTLFQQTTVQHMEHLNVTQDPELQLEKEAGMRIDRPERYGSFVFPENGSSYTGWWLNGMMHGEGTFRFYNMKYEGGFQFSKKHGYGSLTYSTGETYQGQWANDKQNGSGTFTFNNGDVFVGNWKDGKKSGKGELTCKNGDHYSGDWLDDLPDGLGEMRYSNHTVYTGNWKFGLRDMYGILISNGQKYEGQFELGSISGKGRMEWPDGTVYDGFWKDGLKHGNGTFSSPILGKYVGEWAFDCKEGKGTHEYRDGTIYNGQWKRNMYNGTGTITFISGIVKSYKGEFVNSTRQGRGVLEFSNGDSYEGHFKDNHMHGNGVFRWASGATLEAKFTRDKPDGKCTFTPPIVDDGSKKKKKVKEEKKAVTYIGDYCDGMLLASEGPPIYIPNFPLIEITFQS